MEKRLGRIVGPLSLVVATVMSACGAPPQSDSEETVRAQALVLQSSARVDSGDVCAGFPTQTTHCNFGAYMHCCPQGYAIQGAYFITDTLECAKIMEDYQENNCYVEKTNIRNGMRACQPGYYMRGYHKNNAWATCCKYLPGNASTSERVDGLNGSPYNIYSPVVKIPQGYGKWCNDSAWTHFCYSNEVLQGVHVINNYFLCGS